MKFEILDSKGEKTGKKAELNDSIWAVPMNEDLVTQVINVYLDNQRKGTAHARTRGEVSGGGRKPWRQKGTGRARHGSIRSPIWTGGGVAFGPRTYKKYKRVPKKMNKMAMKCVLSDKVNGEALIVVSGIAVDSKKPTKTLVAALENLKLSDIPITVVFSSEGKDFKNVLGAVRNLDKCQVRTVPNVNVYEVANSKRLVMMSDAIKELEERLS